MKNYRWSDWIARPEDEVTKPQELEGVNSEDFEFRLMDGEEKGGDFNLDWGMCESWPVARIVAFRYKISEEPEIKSSETEQALRYNTGKPELSYVLDVMPALKDMVAVMEFGAQKYDRNNWQKGFPKEKLLDSLLRHVDAFYSGEDVDPESGLPHVGHIMCNAAFLAYHNGSNSKYWEDKFGEDNGGV